jgi:glycosyltransferase involved in cell wall biosynthesis
MPVYNGEKFLDEVIGAVLNQTFKDFELIIINDKSTDNSLNIINKNAKRDKRIVVLSNKRNMGAQYTRNRGLKIAKGEYIANLDADDVCLSDRFEFQTNYLDNHPNIFMVGGSAIVIDENGNRIGVFLKYESSEELRKKLPKTNCMIFPSLMYRNTKQFFMREKFPISEDYDIILNMLSAGKNIINFPKFLIKYRVNKSSNTFTKKNPEYFFGKAREFYQQRVDTGKDDYENLKIPDIVIQVDPDKSDLAIHIIAEFQDNQQRKVRENIIKYIKRYGFNLTFVSYYVLSFLPTKIYAHLRRKL